MAEAVLACSHWRPIQESADFETSYAAMIDYMKANCGYAEVNATASEFTFEGLPANVPAGPAIFTLENAGDQVHEIVVTRLNDDVTLSADEINALPEDEVTTMGHRSPSRSPSPAPSAMALPISHRVATSPCATSSMARRLKC